MLRIYTGFATTIFAGLALAMTCLAPAAISQTVGDIEAAREQAITHLGKNEKDLALAAAKRAVSLAEAKFGPQHSEVADCLEILTAASGDESHIMRALAIRVAVRGENHPETARTLLLLSYGILDKPEAEAYLKRAVAILERTGPKEQLGETLSMLSAHYIMTKRIADAEALKPKLDALAKELNP